MLKEMGSLRGYLRTSWWWVWNLLQSTLGSLIVLIITPLVVPILLILWVWRCIVVVLIRIIDGHWVTPATGMEAVFALDSAGARAVICGATILKGKVSVTTVRQHLSERIMELKDAKGNYLHPKFRRVIQKRFGVVVWAWEENFNITRHVKPLLCQRRVQCLWDEDEIVGELAARTNDQFVKGLAKWEVLVAPLKQFDKYFDSDQEEWDYTVVMLRIHHALGDGRSLVGLIVSALADPPLPDPRPSPVCQHPFTSCTTRALRVIWSITHLPWVMIRLLIRGDKSVLHGSRLGGVKHLAWSPPISLAFLKRGRTLAGATVNDILLAGLSSALYRHFSLESPEVPPQVMTVIPVDVTTPMSFLSLGNRISLCTLPLPTERMAPKDRLEAVRHRMNLLKSSPDVMVNYIALDLIANLVPGPLSRRLLHTHGVTMVASNMPGPTKEINLFGETVEDIMFWIPNKSRTGLGVSLLSYSGTVRIGLNVDSELISHRELAQRLLDDMVTEVEKIMADISPPEENEEEPGFLTTVVEDTRSYNSDLTEIVVTHSTDEYDDKNLSAYSDLFDSIDIKKSDELDTTFESDDYRSPKDLDYLRKNYHATRLEIQSFLSSGAERNKLKGKLKPRFNRSETDVNILNKKVQDEL
ncbi:putative diacyglycerol O-acyltransferase Mb3154c [Palaemon carinicauda]|uniref:putative diacyglycerol O-acyltransferase Mb3154c n=1 Tax=Palaemon carinicauda TaxID=392227 RepID=UPI0035B594E4